MPSLAVRDAVFASSSKQAHVISFINPPCLVTLEKDVQASFSHGAYFVDSKMLPDIILEQGVVFQENTSIFLKGSKIRPQYRGIYIRRNEKGPCS